MSLPLGQQRPSPFVTPHVPPAVPHLADTAGIPRYHKMDFPTYDGKEDPLGWLNRCEQFFWGQRTDEAYKVWLAAYHMTGTAQTWYMQLERNEGTPSWPRFKNRCHLLFSPSVRSNCLGELTRLRMTGTVAEYQEKFLALLGHIDALSMAQQVSIYTSGLIDLLKIDMELHNPQDLDTAMSLARDPELRAKVAAAVIIEASFSEKSSMAIGQLQGMPLTGSVPVGDGRAFHRLTTTEMVERREKGLCFNCDEKISRGHRCQRFFYL